MNTCTTCQGKRGSRSKGSTSADSDCAVCDSKGWIALTQSWYPCLSCSNLRCVSCGGTGVAPC